MFPGYILQMILYHLTDNSDVKHDSFFYIILQRHECIYCRDECMYLI